VCRSCGELGVRGLEGGELGTETVSGGGEDVADAGDGVVAVEDGGVYTGETAERYDVAVFDAVGVVGVQPGFLRQCPFHFLVTVLFVGILLHVFRQKTSVLGILMTNQTSQIEHRIGKYKIIQHALHTPGAEYIRRIFPLDKGGRQERVIIVAVGDEDVLGAELVDAQTGVEEQIQLGDDEGGVPGGAGAAGEDVLVVRAREAPFEDVGARGLREGRGEGRAAAVAVTASVTVPVGYS
jgi:hypothetical protein